MLPDSGTLQSSAEEGRGLEDIALKEMSPAEDRSRQTLPLCEPKRAQTRRDGPQEGRSVCNGAEFGSGTGESRRRTRGRQQSSTSAPAGPGRRTGHQRDGNPSLYVLVQQPLSWETNSDCRDVGPHPAVHTVTPVSSTSVQQGRRGDQPRAEWARRARRDPGRLPSFLSGTSSPSRGSLTGNLENVLGPLPKQSTRIPQPAGRRRATGPQGPTLLLSPGAPQRWHGDPPTTVSGHLQRMECH